MIIKNIGTMFGNQSLATISLTNEYSIMKTGNILISIGLLVISDLHGIAAERKQDYMNYHQNIIKAEKLIANEEYKEALLIYEQVFSSYDFIFLKEYQVATQLA